MPYVVYAFSLLLGLVLGSFLNVVIYRLPRHESLIRPGSRCPGCGTSIHCYDNIPVLSWLVLRGRCRACQMRISCRYPLVEAITGLAFLLAMWRFGLTWPVLVAWAFIAAMVAIAFIDYDHMIIPNKIVLPGALLGLIASVALEPQRWWVYVAGSLGAAAFMLVLAMLWPGGMGPGDIKMALFMGAVLGAHVMVALFAAFLFGSIAGIYMMVVQKRSRKAKIPFGPYLALGAVLAVLLGETILRNYQSLYS
ncbi:MAG: prepilin peptidase [Actinobacteria bacterium]|nr:prepilin peptidase [Actinomycetota bacterium]